jgi:hypothetical protein
MTGTSTLRWAWKKAYVIKSLKALQLELIFCTARGIVTRQQEDKAKRKARSYVYVLHHYKKRYNLSINNAIIFSK